MSWLRRLFGRASLETDLDKEMRFHLDQHAEDLVARGHSPAEARRRARLELGGMEQVKEECRDARGTRWVEDVVHDARYAVRSLARQPGFAATALLTLALGTGATTLIFTIINGVLLKPLPYADAGRLIVLQEKTDYSTRFGDLWAFSKPNYTDVKRDATAVDVAAFLYSGGTISTGKQAEYVDGFAVSADLFPMLGVAPVRGRAFSPEEDRPAGQPVAMISDSMSKTFFGGADAAIGRQIAFEEKSYTVIGVTPPGFKLEGGLSLQGEPGVFLPLGQQTAPFLARRDRHGLRVWGRLKPGAGIGDARTQLSVIGSRLAQQYPDSNKGRTFIADPLRPQLGQSLSGFLTNTQSTLWLLLGAVALLLLIACVNVGSLLLARSVARERELAIRMALGAGRARLVRQCLTESAVLSVFGGALGVFVATLLLPPFLAFWPGGLPRAADVQVDWRVLSFTFAVSLMNGLAFGLVPALRAPVKNVDQTLRAASRTVAGGSRRLHSMYVVSELALATILVASAGMLARTMVRLSSVDAGIDASNVLTGRMALAPSTLKSPDAIRAAWDRILSSAHEVPGIEAAAVVDTLPMRDGNNVIGYSTVSGQSPTDPQQPTVLSTCVTPEYLKVMRTPLRAGRFFTDADRIGSPRVVVIDEVMAQKAFAGEDPIGKRIWIDLGAEPWTVIGVVAHVRYWGLATDDQAPVREQLYYPFAQVPDNFLPRWSQLMSIVVRTQTEPLAVLAALRNSVRGTTGDHVIYQVRTMEQLAASSIARQKFLLLLFGILAALALALACVGIYGVLAYLTRQRAPEIGIRMAMGANPQRVVRMVMQQSLLMIGAGVAIGTVGTVAAVRVLVRVVEGVQTADISSYAGAIAVLTAAALIASFLPARQASRVDALQALRQE